MPMSKKLKVKGWKDFQHYKDRAPPWIKLHKGLLDNFEFQRLPVASRALAPMIWLIASESSEGEIDADVPKLAFRLRQSEKEVADGLKPLIDNGFLVGDSDALAECLQDACLETERETEKERETEEEEDSEKEKILGASAPRVVRPKGYSDDFEEAWSLYPRRNGSNSKADAFKAWNARLKEGSCVISLIDGVRRYAAYCRASVTDPRYIQQASTFFGPGRHFENDWAVTKQAIPSFAKQALIEAHNEAVLNQILESEGL